VLTGYAQSFLAFLSFCRK